MPLMEKVSPSLWARRPVRCWGRQGSHVAYLGN
jgi:hypothetical protein